MKQQYLLLALLISLMSCSSDNSDDNNPGEDNGEIPEVFQRFSENVSVSRDGDFILIQTDNLPNHGSPYYDQSNPLYEAYNGNNPNFNLNPNRISEQNITFRIPLNPQEASNKEATPLGPIGVTLNGIVFYNQYAGPNNQPLTNEIDSFDQYWGHPQNQGQYHYHLEPIYLTSTNGSDVLLGWLTDGFPVYGPVENGTRVTNNELDDYHGHSHATSDYPEGIYHYHITDADPYINGSGFYGVVGSVSF